MKKIVKRIALVISIILITLIIIVGGYAIYVFSAYYRLDDNIKLDINEGSDQSFVLSKDYKVMSFNIGFGAYEPDFGFFMDGGSESRAFSKERLTNNIKSIAKFINEQNPDYIFLQEVDEYATRSHYYNERDFMVSKLLGYDSNFAQNWDSPYLFYPIFKPHGKAKTGIMTFSRTSLLEAIRYRLPVETGVSKIVDLDRSYTKSYTKIDSNRSLVLYNAHLSAYTTDGKIAEEQAKMLISDMQQEVANGNYVICGGDFNKDLLADIPNELSQNKGEYTWAQPFPKVYLEGTDLNLISPYDPENPVPSCRNADGPYNEQQYVLTVDGFIVSNNINIKSYRVINTNFQYSDHNPVELIFSINE